jgi:Ca2+-binding RTX toxin-like protein
LVENLTLTGTLATTGIGNTLANTIAGNSAANVLAGGQGLDRLTGGAGADTFVFNTGLNAATNRDTITDFSVADDTIKLENAVFKAFAALAPGATIGAAAFHSGAGVVAAHDASDRIIYNTTTGALFYDADGNTAGGVAAVQFATLFNHPLTVGQADFVII